MLSRLGCGTHFAFISARSIEHLLAELHVALCLLMILFQSRTEIVVPEFFQRPLIKFDSTVLDSEHLGEEFL
jgi:hypothetical protein